MDLDVINQADETLPYGIGFHPWLAREEDSQLQFNAIGCWLEDSQHLPTEHVVPGSGSSSDFRERNVLKVSENAYTGWDGIAELMRPQHGLKVHVKAADPLSCLQIYSPSVVADFVCIEPVNHTVDALNNIGNLLRLSTMAGNDETSRSPVRSNLKNCRSKYESIMIAHFVGIFRMYYQLNG